MKITIVGVLLLWLGAMCNYKVEGAKILSVAFMSSKSHKITYEPLLRELARRGHEVTVYSPIDSKNETNFRNIPMLDMEEVFKKGPNIFELKLTMSPLMEAFFSPFTFMAGLIRDHCEKSYQLPQVKQILREKFDLIFFTPIFNECLWGLVHRMNTSVIVYQQTTVFTWIADQLGTPNPPSFVSSVLTGYSSDVLTFRERLWNLLKTMLDTAVMNIYFNPMMENIYRTYFQDPTIPPIREIIRNTSLVLTNSHISFQKPRPLMADIIEVGGLHLVPAKPVAKELEDFLSGGKDGFILFSMGSALKGSEMPEKYRKMFLNVFSKLKQRVIWKWETETMDDLPPNVKLSKWLPQQDVLGRKNIRLFITHGGHGSTTEAIYHGVPLVGIPMLGDQPTNMLKAADAGFALPPLDFSTLNENILSRAINIGINDPSYRETAKKLSKIFLDQPTKPMDRAVFWVEYVLRHKGANHLRSAARNLNYIQYFSVDVLAVLLIVALVCLKINWMIFKAILRKCFGSKKSKVVDSGKKNK